MDRSFNYNSSYILVEKDIDTYYCKKFAFDVEGLSITGFIDRKYRYDSLSSLLQWLGEHFQYYGPWDLIIHQEEDDKESYITIKI